MLQRVSPLLGVVAGNTRGCWTLHETHAVQCSQYKHTCYSHCEKEMNTYKTTVSENTYETTVSKNIKTVQNRRVMLFHKVY